MALATLSIDLIARIAKFEQNMEKAARLAEKRSADMQRSLAKIRSVAAGLGAGISGAFSVGAVVQFTERIAHNARELDRLSRLSNTTTEEFQRQAFAARSVGIEQDKLADIFKDVQDKVGDFLQNGAGPLADFFENVAPKVGVTAEQFRRLSGPQALQLYYSSLERANLSQSEMTFYMEAIASDSALLAPLLRENGEAFKRLGDEAKAAGAVISEDMVKAGVDLDKQLTILQRNLDGVANKIASVVVPELNKGFQRFQAMTEVFGGFGQALLKLEFSRAWQSDIENLRFYRDQVAGLQRQIDGLQATREKNGGYLTPFDRSTLSRLTEERKSVQQYVDYFQKLADAQGAGAGRGFVNPSLPPQPADSGPNAKERERLEKERERLAKESQRVAQRAAKGYEDLMQAISKKTQAAQLELETGRQLSAEQQFALDVLGRLADQELQLSDAQKQGIAAALEKSLVIQDQARSQRELLELQIAAQGIAERDVEALAAEADSRAQLNEQLRLAIEEMNLTAQEVDALRIKRLEHALAIEEEALAMARNAEASQQEIQLREQSIRLLREQVGLRKKEAAEAGKQFEAMTVFADQAARNIQDSLGSSVRSLLEGDFDSIEDHFKNMLKNMAAQAISANLAQLIIGNFGATGQVGGLLGSLFGSMGGATANADGAAFSRYGRVTAFANGGVFNGPTAFSYAGGKLGVMGEAGPEAVMPLKRGRNGKLGVVAEGGQPVIINQTFHFGEGVNRAELAQWAEGIKRSTMSAIYQSRNRAGAFSQ